MAKSDRNSATARLVEGSPITYHIDSRFRRNVLDLLTVIGGHAVTGYLFIDVDMSAIEKIRTSLDNSGTKVTVTSFILKAIARAQVSHPASRTFAVPFGRSVTYKNIVAGVTVEREVEGKPIVFFGEIEEPQFKPIIDIARILQEYAHGDMMSMQKLRQQILFARLPQFVRHFILFLGIYFPSIRLMCMGATFGVSSLGALGVSAVFGPSVCTCVFGVGAVEPRVVVRHGEIEIRPVATITLSYDQQLLDGAQAARFLQDVKSLLESGLEEDSICDCEA